MIPVSSWGSQRSKSWTYLDSKKHVKKFAQKGNGSMLIGIQTFCLNIVLPIAN